MREAKHVAEKGPVGFRINAVKKQVRTKNHAWNSSAIPGRRARKIHQFPHLISAVSIQEANPAFWRGPNCDPMAVMLGSILIHIPSDSSTCGQGGKLPPGPGDWPANENLAPFMQAPAAATESRQALITRQVLCIQQARRASMSSRRK